MNMTSEISDFNTNAEICLKFNSDEIIDNISYYILYCFLCIFGIAITYFGNKLIKPTIFTGGTIISTMSSYNLLQIAMNYSPIHNCYILYGVSLLIGIIGGYNLLKWYYIINFVLGFSAGSSIGYFLYELYLYKFCLGIIILFDTMKWLSLFIPGFFFGLYSLKKEQNINLLLTPLIGSGIVIYSTNVVLLNKYKITLMFNYVNLFVYLFLYISGFYIQKKRLKKTDIKSSNEDEKQHMIGYV